MPTLYTLDTLSWNYHDKYG